MEDTTTITIGKKAKEKLDKLKIHPRQSYEEVVDELIKGAEKK